jgi:uncharacterized protein
LTYFIVALLSGVISGMGIGGGVVLIPALVFIFHIDQQTAQAVNLIYFIPSSLVALAVHIYKKRIDFKLALWMVISGLGAAALGATLAVNLEEDILKKVFGFFLLGIGLYQLFSCRKDKNIQKACK